MKFEIIEDKEQLYDKCENMEQLYDNYYYNLLVNYQELKKQLEDISEELELVRCDLYNRTSERDSYYRNIEKLENQQKEFIDYLENEIKERNIQIAGYHTTTQLLIEQIIETEKKVLSKYKEIIGDDK